MWNLNLSLAFLQLVVSLNEHSSVNNTGMLTCLLPLTCCIIYTWRKYKSSELNSWLHIYDNMLCLHDGELKRHQICEAEIVFNMIKANTILKKELFSMFRHWYQSRSREVMHLVLSVHLSICVSVCTLLFDLFRPCFCAAGYFWGPTANCCLKKRLVGSSVKVQPCWGILFCHFKLMKY